MRCLVLRHRSAKSFSFASGKILASESSLLGEQFAQLAAPLVRLAQIINFPLESGADQICVCGCSTIETHKLTTLTAVHYGEEGAGGGGVVGKSLRGRPAPRSK